MYIVLAEWPRLLLGKLLSGPFTIWNAHYADARLQCQESSTAAVRLEFCSPRMYVNYAMLEGY